MVTATAPKAPKTAPKPVAPKATSVRTRHDVELDIRATERKLRKIAEDESKGKRNIEQAIDYAGRGKKRGPNGELILPEYHTFWSNQLKNVLPGAKKDATALLARLQKELEKAPTTAPVKAAPPTTPKAATKPASTTVHPAPKPTKGKKTNREIAAEGAAALGNVGKGRRMVKSPAVLAKEAEEAEARANEPIAPVIDAAADLEDSLAPAMDDEERIEAVS